MAALLAKRSLMINQSKYALTPFTYGNKLKPGLRQILRQMKLKTTEEGKTRIACCNVKLMEHNVFVVRHPAAQQETP